MTIVDADGDTLSKAQLQALTSAPPSPPPMRVLTADVWQLFTYPGAKDENGGTRLLFHAGQLVAQATLDALFETATISTIVPATGPAAGGTNVTITGSNFTGTTGVTFGGVAATLVTVVSDTTITCRTGARAGGLGGVVDVVVNDDGGDVTKTGGFTYAATAATIGTVSPAVGPITGNTTVTITGTNLTGTTGVTFGGTAATNLSVASATSLSCRTPVHAAGAVNVVVTDDSGPVTKTNAFTFQPLPATVSTINPATGPAAGGTSVTLTGTNLTGTTAVSFGGVAATSVVAVSATTVTCTTPAHAAGAVDVIVTDDGGPVTKTGFFTYE